MGGHLAPPSGEIPKHDNDAMEGERQQEAMEGSAMEGEGLEEGAIAGEVRQVL